MSHRYKDITGQRFGRLTAIERVGKTKSGNSIWKFICDCGNECLIPASNVKLKNKPTKSCGCLIGIKARERLLGNSPTNMMSVGEASFNGLYGRYKIEARKKHLRFDLLPEEFRYLTKQNCTYCGQEPKSVYWVKTFNGEYIYNGIDRVDSSLGYSLDNCVPCCKRCNQSKSNMTVEEFLSWITNVYKFSVKGGIN